VPLELNGLSHSVAICLASADLKDLLGASHANWIDRSTLNLRRNMDGARRAACVALHAQRKTLTPRSVRSNADRRCSRPHSVEGGSLRQHVSQTMIAPIIQKLLAVTQ
jgi:hypothetical protein